MISFLFCCYLVQISDLSDFSDFRDLGPGQASWPAGLPARWPAGLPAHQPRAWSWAAGQLGRWPVGLPAHQPWPAWRLGIQAPDFCFFLICFRFLTSDFLIYFRIHFFLISSPTWAGHLGSASLGQPGGWASRLQISESSCFCFSDLVQISDFV